MYIHRIVIDANCINAKGRIEAMNELEAFHNAGLIEILITSTLDAEFRTAPLQREKARKYIRIGGSCVTYAGNDRCADAMPGAVTGDSKFYKYYMEIFGDGLSEEARRRSTRDCLHIDQAILNNTNYFVTNENLLIAAGQQVESIQATIKIATPEDCLSDLKEYFYRNYHTTELEELEFKLKRCGPVILGSNTSYGFSITDPVTSESLLSSYIDNGHVVIEGNFRNEFGELFLKVSRNTEIRFYADSASVHFLGKGPLAFGDGSFTQISIGKGDTIYLSARALSSNRVLFDVANLFSSDGKRKLSINREALQVIGLNIGGPPRPI